jgi:hypothetical protein
MRKEEGEAKEEEEAAPAPNTLAPDTPAPAPESAKSPAPAPAAANGATEPVCSPELQAAMKKLEQQKRTYAEFRRAANTKQRLDFIREAAPELAEQEMKLIKAEAIVQERMEQALARHNAKAAPAEATEVAA